MEHDDSSVSLAISDSKGMFDGKFPQCFLQNHKTDFRLISSYVFASVSFLCPAS